MENAYGMPVVVTLVTYTYTYVLTAILCSNPRFEIHTFLLHGCTIACTKTNM